MCKRVLEYESCPEGCGTRTDEYEHTKKCGKSNCSGVEDGPDEEVGESARPCSDCKERLDKEREEEREKEKEEGGKG